MTRLNVRTLLSAGIAGSMVLAAAASAQADDGDRWDRDRGRDRHHYVPEYRHHVVHEHYVEAPRRVVYERPPVVYVPAPVYQAPMYSQPADPSLNFNFTIPLR